MLKVESNRPAVPQIKKKAVPSGGFSRMLEAHRVYGDSIPSIRLSEHTIISIVRGERDYFRAE